MHTHQAQMVQKMEEDRRNKVLQSNRLRLEGNDVSEVPNRNVVPTNSARARARVCVCQQQHAFTLIHCSGAHTLHPCAYSHTHDIYFPQKGCAHTASMCFTHIHMIFVFLSKRLRTHCIHATHIRMIFVFPEKAAMLGDFSAALKAYDGSLRLEPNDPSVRTVLACLSVTVRV
jgi:hypothetical protein